MFSLVGIATRAIRNGREKSKSAPEESFEIQIKDKKHKVEYGQRPLRRQFILVRASFEHMLHSEKLSDWLLHGYFRQLDFSFPDISFPVILSRCQNSDMLKNIYNRDKCSGARCFRNSLYE